MTIIAKKLTGGGNTLSFLLAMVLALVTSGVWAADLYWKGGTGTEADPADIYDPANWTTSSSYSGDSITQSPTTSDILNFKFSELTYLTNSMENADSAAVCSEVNFKGGNCVLLGAIRSASTFRLAQSAAVEVQIAEGGTLYAGGVLAIGCGKNATLTVNGGTVYSKDDLRVGNNSNSIAILNINGGIVEVDYSKTLALSYNGNGTVNLNGGTLITKCVKKDKGNGYLNFDGGTLQANTDNTTDFIGALTDMVNVLSGGGTIDANGHKVKITKSITGEGAMIFKGDGTITFSHNCNHEGGTTIELGTKVSMQPDKTTTILNNLVIDGRAVLKNQTYDVFLKSGLTVGVANYITLVNCAADSTVGFTSEKITVILAAPIGVSTTTSIMAFEGTTLNEIKYADFTSRMFGAYANDYNALDSAKGCNKKFYYDGDGNLSSIVVEFQAYDGANIRCVVVEFTDGKDGDGVYAKALGARYLKNAPLGFVFLEQNKTTWHGEEKTVATSYDVNHYGVCDFRWTQGEHSVTAWTLDEDKTWTTLRNGATLASDEIVQIMVTRADAVLTVDEDVNVGLIEFVNGTGTTLSISSGVTVSADSYSGLGFVLNNGTFQKWGEGTVEMKFDNASRGVFVVNAGTLRAAGKKTPVLGAGTPIIGDPDVTPRSNYLIDVKSGATYDVNGQTSVLASVRLAEGAHFISSANANKAWGQTIQLILAGDAEVTANGDFGLYGSGEDGCRLDLGNYKLIVNGAQDKEFMLGNTTINGTGTIFVKSGRFCTRNAESTGVDCTLSIGENGKFENNMHFTVKNFVNDGSMSYQNTANGWGRGGVLEVTGGFTSKTGSFPKLTLTGATVKADGSHITVLDNFETSGTITIDASAITRQQLNDAGEVGIPVLTVPTENKGGAWKVANSVVGNVCAKWKDNGDDTSTLYLSQSKGLMIIIR